MSLREPQGRARPAARDRAVAWAARCATVIATIATALATASWLGRWSAVADGLAFVAPAWICVGVVASLLAGIMSRRWRWPATLLALLAGSALSVVTSLVPAAAPRAGAGATLKIISLNAWKDNPTPDIAADWILKEAPDIVVLLEGGGQSLEIVRRLGEHYPCRTTCLGDVHCSTLIFSKMPPIERRGLARGDADNRQALSAALVRFGSPYPPFTLIAVHLAHSWPFGDQARDIAALLATPTPRQGVILAGDFNAPPWSAALGRIERGFQARRITGGFATWPAPPSGLPLPAVLPIDHVLVGAGWAVRDLRRGPPVGSDHYPLVVTLTAIAKPGR